jgi:hypothetical protein
MRLLTCHQLDTQRVRAQFAKLQQAVARDGFKSPNLKKMAPTPYWRFKLDHTHRLLVQIARHGNETVCLAQQQTSSQQEWAQEAPRLELQGKQELADAIRKNVLKTQKPNWPVWDEAALQERLPKALPPGQISNEPRQAMNPELQLRAHSGADWCHGGSG